MSDEWVAPSIRNGSVSVNDWPPVRAAIEGAYRALGRETPSSIPTEEWNLVALAMDFHKHASRSACLECRTPLFRTQEIRCLDCKAVVCETCAPKHFWPNGRPNRKD